MNSQPRRLPHQQQRRGLSEMERRLHSLREEARTGYESQELRRTLIKDDLQANRHHRLQELKQKPQLSSGLLVATSPSTAALGLPMAPVWGGSNKSTAAAPTSTPVNTNVLLHGAQTADRMSTSASPAAERPRVPSSSLQLLALPPQLCNGDFVVSSSYVSETRDSPSPVKTEPPSAQQADHVASTSPVTEAPPSSSVLLSVMGEAADLYTTLCAAVDCIDYDVVQEDQRRTIQSRDGRSGMATQWVVRQGPLSGQPTRVDPCIQGGMPSSISPKAVLPHPFVTSSSSISGNGVYMSAISPPSHRPTSRASSQSTTTTSIGIGNHDGRYPEGDRRLLHHRSSGVVGRRSEGATCGTAVVNNTAAGFAASLRKKVDAHRRSSTRTEEAIHGDGWPVTSRDDSFLSTTGLRQAISSRGTGEGETDDVFITRLLAPKTVCFCSRCSRMTEQVLADKPVRVTVAPAAAANTADEAAAVRIRDRNTMQTICQSCGALAVIPVAPSTDWLLPPMEQPPAAPVKEILLPSEGVLKTASRAAGHPAYHNNGNLRNERSSDGNGGKEILDDGTSCGSDAIGFSNDDGTETFAELIAKIRASRRSAESISVKSTAPSRSVAATGTDSNGALQTSACVAEVGATHRKPSAEEDKSFELQARLRAALSMPYFAHLVGCASRGMANCTQR